MGAILALQLASKPNSIRFLCPNVRENRVLVEADDQPYVAKSFLSSVLSSSSFARLLSFSGSPAPESKSGNLAQTNRDSLSETDQSRSLISQAAAFLFLRNEIKDSRLNGSADSTPLSTPIMSRSVSQLSLADKNTDDYIPIEVHYPHELLDDLDSTMPSDRQNSFKFLCRNLRSNLSRPEFWRTGFGISTVTIECKSFNGMFYGLNLSSMSCSFSQLLNSPTLQSVERLELQHCLISSLDILYAKFMVLSTNWRMEEGKEGAPIEFKNSGPAIPPHINDRDHDIFIHLRSITFSLLLLTSLQSELMEDTVFKLANLVSRLHRSVRVHFMAHLAISFRTLCAEFQKLVLLFRSVICKRYRPESLISSETIRDPGDDSAIVSLVRAISFLYNVNEYSAQVLYEASNHHGFSDDDPLVLLDGTPLRTLLPFWTFYLNCSPRNHVFFQDECNDDEIILSNLSVKNLYFKHLKIRRDGGSPKSLSLLSYPFLLDPILKTSILRLENLTWMSSEFEEAFVRQGFVGSLKRAFDGIGIDEATSDHRSILESIDMKLSFATVPYFILEVRRQNIVEDSIEQIKKKWTDIHKPLKIKFADELGVDQGGVQKEYFQLMLRHLFDDEFGLFKMNEETKFSWPSLNTEKKELFHIVGLILGLAIYNGVMVDVNLPLVFFKKLLAFTTNSTVLCNLDDLFQVEPSICRSLRLLLAWNTENGRIEDIFSQTFSISVTLGEKDSNQYKNINLVENGEKIFVNEFNRDQFVQLYLNYLLEDSVKSEFQVICDGFWRVLGGPSYLQNSMKNPSKQPRAPHNASILELFRAEELRALMTGLSSSSQKSIYSSASFEDLKRYVKYENYSTESPVISWFWDVVLNEFTDHQRRKLLWFVTASDRLPLGGYSKLNFTLQKNGSDSDRLPTSSTCFSRLLLPEYESKVKLSRLLSRAVEESTGFGLL